MTTQKPNKKTGKETFEDAGENTAAELAITRKALEDLVVAMRGGGNLSAAIMAAQTVLDQKTPAVPNFASDEAAELALKLNGEGKLATAEIATIKGSGHGEGITVKDIEAYIAARK